MAALDQPRSPDPQRARAVLQQAIAGDVGRLCEYEPLVREGSDPEAVHQARVACRRLRSQLRTFAPALREGAVGEVVSELRWLSRLLGQLRDLDVLGERLADDCRELDPALSRPVLQRCAMDRQEAFAGVIMAMRDKRYLRLLTRLESIAANPPVKRSCADRPASIVLMPEVRRRWLDLDRAVSALEGPATDTELHHVRILSKRARYSAEVAAEFGPGELGRLGSRVAKVQKVLGALNDASRTVAWLEGLKAFPWPRTSLVGSGDDPLVVVELALAAEHRALAALRSRWREPMEAARDCARALGWQAATSDADRGRDALPVRR